MKDMSDWTRKGPLPDLPGQQRRPSERGAGGYRQFDERSDAGGERRRPPPFSSDGKERDFGNWERKGPLSPVPQTGSMREGGRVRSNDGPREGRQSPAWGEGRSNEGSRPPRREFSDRPQYERQPTAPELDNQWRSKMRPDAPVKSPTGTPDASTPSSPAPQPAAPATRPRLNLAKRTVSEAPEASAASAHSDSKSNPFGAARPIDTAAREREVEEKRQLAIRQKKEADDKAREERKAKETAEKTVTSPKTEAPAASGEKKDNGDVEKPAVDDSAVPPEVKEADAPANGDVVEDKSVKPKEVVRDAKFDNSWRRKSSTPAASTPTTEKMDEDGWSTVTKPTKNQGRGGRGRGGGGPTRAIAS